MSLLSLFGLRKKRDDEMDRPLSGGQAPSSQDTLAAINELSSAVKNNPDAVEIYLALGNLYRSQGEIERAVQIRNSLIVRPSLDARFKAKAWFELARDYKRGGFYDRALTALQKAGSILNKNREIIYELALLAAETRDYLQAATHFSQINQDIPQAHYLCRLAEEAFVSDDRAAGKRWLSKALKVLPSSPEAWTLRVKQSFMHKDWKRLEKYFQEALGAMTPGLRFLLLEALLANETSIFDNDGSTATSCALKNEPQWFEEGFEPSEDTKQLASLLIPHINDLDPDLLLTYYGALLLASAGDKDKTELWFERAILLDTDFWPARLGLMSLNLEGQSLDSSFSIQMSYLLRKGNQTKRFFCSSCGLKRDRAFFSCPRCKAWHSITFRRQLQD